MGYRHLTLEQRYQIAALWEAGLTRERIALSIGCHPCTVGRELRRNDNGGRYEGASAHRKACTRRSQASTRSHLSDALLALIDAGLARRWSPEQIRGRGLRMSERTVSHTTIYRHLHRKGYRLQGRGSKRRKRYGRGRRLRFGDRRTIHTRPPEVAALSRFGDWELDTVRPARGGGVIVSMNERRSGYVRLAWAIDGTAEAVAEAIIQRLRPLRDQVHTLTCDRGSEFAATARIERGLGAQMYYADPRAPWQRARNEHLNGLLREYFPRAMNFCDIGFERLQQAENALNDRPRKRLGFLTPAEVFFGSQRIALQS